MGKLDNYPDEVKDKLEYFLENSNLDRMSRTVRKLFFSYLRDCKEGLSVDFDEILFDVETLINFLESRN